MKTLKNLDEKPSLIIEDNLTPEQLKAVMPFRTMFRLVAGNCVPKPGTEESLDLHQIGLKLRVTGDVSLEDAEFKLLEGKIKDNPLQWPSNLVGQLLLITKKAEEDSKTDKK